MKSLLLSIFLFFTTTVNAETIILPVQDLLLEVPNYEAPSYGFNAGLNGRYTVTEIPKSKREKNMNKKLIDLAWDIYPDAVSIRMFRGNLIITK
jgi:hypothetical protein